mmetsp:Transcript_19671/g.22503  ORF Transcript_19671/g.22503 Transcript_19671/m.22503 type:complete len:765 (+) Transcript_19671:89-2383(+)
MLDQYYDLKRNDSLFHRHNEQNQSPPPPPLPLKRNNRIIDRCRNFKGKGIQIRLLSLLLSVFLLYSGSIMCHRHRWSGMALLRSHWERLLLLLLDPKTKILKKTNGEIAIDDIIVLVMGEADLFQDWYDKLKDVQNPDLYLVYASYDSEVPVSIVDEKIAQNVANIGTENGSIPFHTIHIPDKTWTEGRNLLAAEALRKEKVRGKKFSYWFFLDDDVEPTCHPATEKVYGESGSCWQKVFTFLTSEAVPEKASTVALPMYLKDGFVATSNVNSFNAAFKRSRVPYLLPYVSLPKGASQWIAQAANMCVVGSCMANSVVFVPLIYSTNSKHRKHPTDGYTVQNIQAAIEDNFHDESINFIPCQDWDKMRYYSEGEFSDMKHQMLGPYPSCEELNGHISYTKQSYCTPLRKRFTVWEQKVLSESSEIIPQPKPSNKYNAQYDKLHNDKINKNIVVMVMGEASAFQDWLHQLRGVNGANINFIFGSYDTEIIQSLENNTSSDDADATNQNFDHQIILIQNTTWSEGRNRLAREALQKENSFRKQFDYWLFLDDDIQPICHPGSEIVLGVGSCWQQIFNFLSSDMVPEMASTIVLPFSAKEGFASTSNAGSSFAAFKRESLPYLIPYVTLPEGSNQRISQAANFCIMGTCLSHSAVFVPYVTVHDSKSRPAVREGFNINKIHETVTQNFHDESKHFIPCHDWNTMAFYEQRENGTAMLGPFHTSGALNLQIPPHKHGLCAPLRQRFMDWETNVMKELDSSTAATTSAS